MTLSLLRLYCSLLLAIPLALSFADSHACAADITSGEDAVILEESWDIDIRSPEEVHERYHQRVQILTPHGADEYKEAGVAYSPWVDIKDFHGSVEPPHGKKFDVKKQNVVDSASFPSFVLYADSKQRVMIFPGAVPGAVIDYGYEKEIRNIFFMDHTFPLQDDIPIRLRMVTVTAPASFPLRITVRGGQPEYTRSEQDGRVTHRWLVRDAPGFKPESDMPPKEDVIGNIVVMSKEIVWDNTRIDASNWGGIASWDWGLVRERVTPTPEVTQQARALTAGVSEPLEQTRRLYDFVRSQVAYVAISLGIGGWQPHAAADVLRNRYGDCKDKATLLISMMRSVGLVGYPVLVRTRDDGLIDRDAPSPSFNHAIVAIPQENGYLFLDPTAEKAPFGDLPYMDQGVSVLVVKDDGSGELVETPLFPPEANRSRRVTSATLNSQGDLTGSFTIEMWGQARLEMIYGLAYNKPSEQEDIIKDMIGWLCPGARLISHETSVPTRPEDPLRITIRFEVPHFVTRAGSLEVLTPYLDRFPYLTRIAAYSRRRSPVFFKFLYSVTSETRLRLPPGRTLKKVPQDRDSKGPGLTATTKHELVREGDYQVLVVRRSVSVSKREIPVSDYPALRDFLSEMSQEESRAVTLETVATTFNSLDTRQKTFIAGRR